MTNLPIGTTMVTIMILGMLTISHFQQQNSTELQEDNNLTIVRGYTLDLQEQRENCYNNILLLGLLDDQQIEKVKQELKVYLKDLEEIDSKIQNKNIKNQILNESIKLDILLIKKTLTAIETKDERYLYDISEIYHNLIKYHDLLNV